MAIYPSLSRLSRPSLAQSTQSGYSFPMVFARLTSALGGFAACALLAQPLTAVGQQATKTAVAVHPVIDAKTAFMRKDSQGLARSRARLAAQDDPLVVWADYWEARLLISKKPFQPVAIEHLRGFQALHHDHPLARALQNDLLVAGIRGRSWPDLARLLSNLPPDPHHSEPTGIACSRARLVLTNETLGEAMGLARGNETLEGCLSLMEDAAGKGLLNRNEITIRARWAALMGSQASGQRLWKASQADGIRPMPYEFDLLNILATSRSNSAKAANRFEPLAKRLNPEQQSFARFALGSRLWMRTDRRAWSYLALGIASAPDQPPEIIEAAARLALRRAEPELLRPILAAMPELLRNHETWVYWRGWLMEQQGRPELARALWETIPEGWSFYRLLASEALNRPLLPMKSEPDYPERYTIGLLRPSVLSDPFLGRSLSLASLGLRAEAIVEWNALMNRLPDLGLLAASQLALEAGLPDRAIAAAIRTQDVHDFRLRYPKPFKELIEQEADRKGLKTGWVMGLIRQESRFLPKIKSPVGAAGLMQIMPATANSVARGLGMGRVDARRLVEPSFNLRLGTAYLQQMHSRFNGSAVLASAAYNAGPSRSQLWQSSIDRQVPGAAFAESIPFTETRDYVKQVLANTVMYETMLALSQTPSQPARHDDASSQRLSAWLSHIEPSSRSSSSR